MLDNKERVVPGSSDNYLYQESLARYNFALKYIKKGSVILDNGCGSGYGSNLLSTKGKVYAIDKSSAAIDFARNKYGQSAKFELGNVEQLTYKKSEFDCVCSFEVIEHLKHADKYLREIKRVLNKNGILLISTPDKNRQMVKGIKKSKFHLHEYELSELDYKLRQYFNKINYYYQEKSSKAQEVYYKFLDMQKVRQQMVDIDYLKIRKIFPKSFKENVWKYIKPLFGNIKQSQLTVDDYIFNKKYNSNCQFIIAVCKK